MAYEWNVNKAIPDGRSYIWESIHISSITVIWRARRRERQMKGRKHLIKEVSSRYPLHQRKEKKRYTRNHRPCADQRHLNPGTRGNENMEAGCEAPSCCCSHRTLPSAALPLLAGGPEFSLTSAAISGFLLRFHWGRKDYYYCYFFTSEKSFLFPKAKNSSNEIPPFFSFFCSFTS